MYETGYHTLPYFLADWERFKHIPLVVLAHSTHVRGSGVMEHAVSNRRLRLGPALKSHLQNDPGTAMRRCKVDWRDIIFPSPK